MLTEVMNQQRARLHFVIVACAIYGDADFHRLPLIDSWQLVSHNSLRRHHASRRKRRSNAQVVAPKRAFLGLPIEFGQPTFRKDERKHRQRKDGDKTAPRVGPAKRINGRLGYQTLPGQAQNIGHWIDPRNCV